MWTWKRVTVITDYNTLNQKRNHESLVLSQKNGRVIKPLFHRKISTNYRRYIHIRKSPLCNQQCNNWSGPDQKWMLTPLGRGGGPNILNTLRHMLLLRKQKEKVPFAFVKSGVLQLNQRIKLHITSVGTKWLYKPPDVMQREVNSVMYRRYPQDPPPPCPATVYWALGQGKRWYPSQKRK